jgi:hypothetical protein
MIVVRQFPEIIDEGEREKMTGQRKNRKESKQMVEQSRMVGPMASAFDSSFR